MRAPAWLPERHTWVSAFRPAAVRVGWAETLVVVVLGTVVALFRLGDASLRGVMWAEDAQIFLTGAYQHGLFETLFAPYRGYALTLPRVVAWVVADLPIETQGVAVSVASCVIQACLAALAYHVVAAHTPPQQPGRSARALARVAPLLSALAVVAVPVGPEVVSNLANLQWFVLFTGCLVLFWTPTRVGGNLVVIAMLLIVTTTSPFGGAAVALAAVACLVARSRWSVAVLVAGILGLAAQVYAMNQPSHGEAQTHSTIRPRLLLSGYLKRVLGDGLFGVERHLSNPSDGILVAVVALLLVLGTAVALLLATRAADLAMPLVLGALSFLCFGALMVVSGMTVTVWFGAARYYVPPVLFLLTGTAIMVGRALRPRLPRTFATIAVRALAILLAGVTLYGTGSTWDTSSFSYGRASRPGWTERLPAARHECAAIGRTGMVKILTAPGSWGATVPCDRLLPR